MKVKSSRTFVGILTILLLVFVPFSTIPPALAATSTLITAPQPPTGLTATAVSSSKINLSWTAPSNNGGSPITGYDIERSDDGGSTWNTIVSNTGSTATTYTDTGHMHNKSYTYRVSAINAVGTSLPSSPASATTTPSSTGATVPQPPTSLIATTVSSSQIGLSWTAPTNDGGSPITGYKIERSTNGGSTWSTLVSNTGSVSTTYSNTGLSAGTSYTYRVSAINAVGTSSPSNVASATTTTTPSLRFITFPPSITTGTLNVLNTYYQAGDGIISSRVDNIESIQDKVQVAGQEHYILAPHIGPIDPSCALGPVEDVATFVSEAQVAKTKGYDIDAILYDIEGWCWTPSVERQNFVASVDEEAQIAHAGGFKSGIQPTHDLLVQYYKQIHFQNVDFLLIQFQKYLTSKSSGYTQMDPNYITTVQDIINTARSENPDITIFIQYNLNWSPESVMEDSVSHFASQIQGASLVDLPTNDPDLANVPFPNNNTADNQAKFIAFVKSQ